MFLYMIVYDKLGLKFRKLDFAVFRILVFVIAFVDIEVK